VVAVVSSPYHLTRAPDHDYERLLRWLSKKGDRAKLNITLRTQQITKADLMLWHSQYGGFSLEKLDGTTYVVKETSP